MKHIKPIEISSPFSKFLSDEMREAMPPPEYEVGGYFIEEVEMRDGAKLLTKVCVPDRGERWPCLFMRTPYEAYWEMGPANAIPFIEQGYVVVIQYCRGTNGSDGEYKPFENERNDGIDAIKWLSAQPWQDGNIGTFGASYMAFNQWVISDSLPPEVKTMYIDSGGADWYAAVYANGMFRHDCYTSWPVGNFGDKDNLEEVYRAALDTRPHNTMDERVLGRKIPYYQEFIKNTARSDLYWADSYWRSTLENPAKINVPICVVEGWFDHNVESVMAGIRRLRPEIAKQCIFMFGPWDHIGQMPDDVLEYPDGDKFGPGRSLLMLSWFDRMLKGKKNELVSEYYAIGEGKWHTLDFFKPDTEKVTYYIGADKTLTGSHVENGEYRYEYDPAMPLYAIGGSDLMSWIGGIGFSDRGPQLQPEYSDRFDVLVFKTCPLPDSLLIKGSPVVSLEVISSAPDTSFMVRLSEQFDDGRTVNIADSASSILLRGESETILKYTPGSKVVLTFRMCDIFWQLKKGSRLRLDISSSNFPMYHLHPNKVGIWSAIEDWDKANQVVCYGSEKSAVYLPIMLNK